MRPPLPCAQLLNARARPLDELLDVAIHPPEMVSSESTRTFGVVADVVKQVGMPR